MAKVNVFGKQGIFARIGKKNLLVLTAILLIGVAVYLNYIWFYNPLSGIGYGDNRSTLKIEVYAEDGGKVESLCAYEKPGFGFSEDYKSYFIDRENGLVGLAVSDQTTGNLKFRYILLAYNGYELVEVENVLFDGYIDIAFARAVLADGYFYVMARDQFEFFKVFE